MVSMSPRYPGLPWESLQGLLKGTLTWLSAVTTTEAQWGVRDRGTTSGTHLEQGLITVGVGG